MFKAKFTGLKEVITRLEQFDKKLALGVDEELSKGALNISLQARLRCPKGRRQRIASSIAADIASKYRKTVTVGVSFAPFVEFGTGVRVFQTPEFNFTPEMREYAREFYVNGLGKEPARPFLLPSFEVEKPQILKRIKENVFKF